MIEVHERPAQPAQAAKEATPGMSAYVHRGSLTLNRAGSSITLTPDDLAWLKAEFPDTL